MKKIRILGIAPYEAIKQLMQQAAAKRNNIELEVFIGDMIQEGNIVLMLALKEIRKEKDEEEILEQIRAGMLAALESQTEVKRRDHKMVEKVTELDETIKSMKEEYGRKVSVDEVADRLGIREDEIEDILKLAGEEVKDEE